MNGHGIGNARARCGATWDGRIAWLPLGARIKGHWLPLLFTVAMLAAAGRAGGGSDDRPSAFLEGATIPRAKGLALDAALIKGWRVARTERTYVVFETYLDEPASRGPAGSVAPERTLLRIRADFAQTPAGVNVYLYAEEIWYPGSATEWVSNVTPHYRQNLANALASLKAQWAGILGDSRGRPAGPATGGIGAAKVRASALAAPLADVPTSRPPPAAPPPAPEVTREHKVGTWAYHAEQFARDRGCSLSDRGAELVTADDTGELHRVYCDDGSTMNVQCDRETCYGVR